MPYVTFKGHTSFLVSYGKKIKANSLLGSGSGSGSGFGSGSGS